MTIVVITHEMRVIDEICDRVAIIDKSHIAETGKVSQVFANSRSEIGKELILPESRKEEWLQESAGRRIRVIFDGLTTKEPIISSLVLECQCHVSILYADTKEYDGVTHGHMILQLPEDDRQSEKVLAWLDGRGITYREEV